jgi:hypothetical protein
MSYTFWTSWKAQVQLILNLNPFSFLLVPKLLFCLFESGLSSLKQLIFANFN